HIPDMHGCEGACRTFLLLILTSDHPYRTSIIRQSHHRYVTVQYCLVTWRSHLVFGGQINPKLHHLQRTTLGGECFGVKLFMQYAGTCGHPLHVPGTDGTALPG